MKKYTITVLAILLALPSVYAKNNVVSVYSQPDTKSKMVTKVKPFQHLIPIFHQNGWVKIGDPKNGQTGWINLKQYHQAQNVSSQPKIERVTINVTDHPAKSSKTEIVAYRNGKKLTDKEAKKLYHRLTAEQEEMNQQMDKMFQHTMHQMQKMHHMMDRQFDF